MKTVGYVARANIDHYLDLLRDHDVPATNRATIIKLLVAEEDKLGHALEQIEFAEDRAAMGRARVDRQRNLRDSFIFGSTERAQADRLLANLEAIQHLLDHFCRSKRDRRNSLAI
ncbi:hypothetical protein JQ543_11945 [Bradyrhizobium diazoefficiens]|nr:hypothetical protein [Bradyrhizobium diazoefficiens]MBR0848454.1 hypothetical protein [Bradyrhizobium diazoefficiens]